VRELAILKKEKKIKCFDQMDAIFPSFSFHTLLVSTVVGLKLAFAYEKGLKK
jgi:hypothetical protein